MLGCIDGNSLRDALTEPSVEERNGSLLFVLEQSINFKNIAYLNHRNYYNKENGNSRLYKLTLPTIPQLSIL